MANHIGGQLFQLENPAYPINLMFHEIQFPINRKALPEKTSMIKLIAAITFIFLCTTVAWAILGATIFQRLPAHLAACDSHHRSVGGE